MQNGVVVCFLVGWLVGWLFRVVVNVVGLQSNLVFVDDVTVTMIDRWEGNGTVCGFALLGCSLSERLDCKRVKVAGEGGDLSKTRLVMNRKTSIIV